MLHIRKVQCNILGKHEFVGFRFWGLIFRRHCTVAYWSIVPPYTYGCKKSEQLQLYVLGPLTALINYSNCDGFREGIFPLSMTSLLRWLERISVIALLQPVVDTLFQT